jgi:hypothetical protein
MSISFWPTLDESGIIDDQSLLSITRGLIEERCLLIHAALKWKNEIGKYSALRIN